MSVRPVTKWSLTLFAAGVTPSGFRCPVEVGSSRLRHPEYPCRWGGRCIAGPASRKTTGQLQAVECFVAGLTVVQRMVIGAEVDGLHTKPNDIVGTPRKRTGPGDATADVVVVSENRGVR